MAKKQGKIGRPAKGNKALLVRIRPEIAKALSDYVDRHNETHVRTEKSAHVERALVEYLKSQGAWPAPSA